MRKIKEVLRLSYEQGRSRRQVAASAGLGRATVAEYLRRFEAAGLAWPAAAALDDTALERALFPPVVKVPAAERGEPDWAHVHRELRRPGVTLMLLWQEYKATHPQGYQYSWFCERYAAWAGRRDLTMRQHHRAGEKLFVDYAGQRLEVIDPRTGELQPVQIFVAVLGASNYTYAEATWSQRLPDWIGSHVRAFAFFGGVPEVVVPDNLKAAVTRASRYVPEINDTYAEMARHYAMAVLPARPYKPKDKAKAEVAVQVVERWILARLRHQTFHSLAALNAAIRELLVELNERRLQRQPHSRRELFERLDRPAMQPLPEQPYVYAEWKYVKPGIDYHVEIERRLYSVPHALVGHRLEARISATAVEIFHKGNRVAVHARHGAGAHSTVAEHMPAAHRKHQQWTPGRFLNWAKAVGPATLRVVREQLEHRPHPEHGYRACLGLRNLARHYGNARLEAACERGARIGSPSYRSVASILKSGLDRTDAEPEATTEPLPLHANIRGPGYYH